jgi:uncharacterized protein YbaR (Trm112 family)
MSPDASKSPELTEWIDRLACPACLSTLHVEEGRIVCTSCGRVYPVVDGIPVLIAEHGGETAQ